MQDDIDFEGLLEGFLYDFFDIFGRREYVRMRFSCGSGAILNFRVNEVELRENIEIASPGALKMEAFQAHLGVQTVKNEGQEGIEKTMPKRKPFGSEKYRKASRL